MKISFWIPAVVLSVVRVAFSNNVQVGTVLFTTADLVKKCWTESDKSLLKARLVMQDVLPDPDCIDFSNPNAVAVLLDYFHSCFQIISTSTYGRVQNMMLLALSDALGGYLRAYVLPFTKRAYYAGEVRYLEAKRLFQLYDDIRVFLKTNGVGWVEPQKLCLRHLRARPLVVTTGNAEACKPLYIIEKEGKLHSINIHQKDPESTSEKCPTDSKTCTGILHRRMKREEKKWKLHSMNVQEKQPEKKTDKSIRNRKISTETSHRKTKREETEEKEETCWNFRKSNHTANEGLLRCLAKELDVNRTEPECYSTEKPGFRSLKRLVVPLPILDDCANPHSIAVPFKKRPFRNLLSGESAFILEYYYLSVIQCFIGKGATRADIANFNDQFHSWLTSEVTPHLCKEQWYPGFGGVLRVMQTIKKFGENKSMKDSDLQDIAFLFSEGTKFDVSDTLEREGKTRVRDVTFKPLGNERHVLIAGIVVSLFWLLAFCAIGFCYLSTKRCQLTRYSSESCRSYRENPQPERRNVAFQFLVRFFKRQENACVPHEHPPDVKTKSERDRNCDCLFNLTSTAAYPVQVKRLKTSRAAERRGQGDEVQTLWKKPSIPQAGWKCAAKEGHGMNKKRFQGRRSTFKYADETSSCTTSGHHEVERRHATTYTCSTRGGTSSSTMEFFEEINARCKKTSTECSTEESDWSTTVSEC